MSDTMTTMREMPVDAKVDQLAAAPIEGKTSAPRFGDWLRMLWRAAGMKIRLARTAHVG